MIKPDFKYDLMSSIVVFFVALPLCLGIALASNAPLASGLLSGIIGGVVVGLFSNSQLSVSGPAAGLTVIVASGISQVGGFHHFSLAVIIAGVFQIIFSLLKGGKVGAFFPTAVIKGMLASIGLILILKQFRNTLGLPSGSLSPYEIKSGVVMISIISLTIMLWWEKMVKSGHLFFQLLPGPLVAVVTSVVLNQFFQLVPEELLVQLPKTIFNDFSIPNFNGLNLDIIKLGFIIAVVASLETLLSIDAADKIDPYKRKTNKNTELFAQGLGNTLCGLAGGLPVTAVIVRTSANMASGAKTKYSAIFHGLWILLFVLFIPNLLNMIPLATLASMLLLVGYKLSKPIIFKEMYNRGLDQLVVFCFTIIMVLLSDLLVGILLGFILAIILDFRNTSLNPFEIIHEEGFIHFKFRKNISFLHKPGLVKALSNIGPDKTIHLHNLEMVQLHVDVREVIQEFQIDAKNRNMNVVIK